MFLHVCVSQVCGLVCFMGCLSAFVYVGVCSVFTCVSERLCVCQHLLWSAVCLTLWLRLCEAVVGCVRKV